MPPPPVSITPTAATIVVGGTVQLVSVPPNGVKWRCTNCSVVRVSGTGLVTGVSVGVAVITGRRGGTTDSVTITVIPIEPEPPTPEPPSAQLAIEQLVSVAAPVIFDTSGTLDPDNDLFSWQLEHGDATSQSGSGAPPQYPEHTYAAAGTYTVTLTVIDTGGRVASTSLEIVVLAVTPTPQPPVAALAVTTQADAGSPSEVSTAGTTDPDGTLVFHQFLWGDEQADSDATPPPATKTHTYAAAGVYTVTLFVTDDQGLSASVATTITVQAGPTPPTPPTVALTYQSGADTGSPYVFSTAGTSAGLTSHTINYGDGTVVGPTAGDVAGTISHAYAQAGTFEVALTVVKDGLSATAVTTAAVQAPPPPTPPPTAMLGYISGGLATEPYVVSLDGTTTPILSGSVTWGDGQTTTLAAGAVPVTRSHTYAAAGTYTATLSVTTVAGTGSATLTITILPKPTANQPPIAQIAWLGGIYLGDTFQFSTAGTQDLDGTIANWALSHGDGTSTTGSGAPPGNLGKVYSATGTRTVTWAVTDNLGAQTVTTISIVVLAAPTGGGSGNAFFDALVARSDRTKAWSLRDQAQINARTNRGTSYFWTYDAAFDAAKLFKPPRDEFNLYPQFVSYGTVGDENVPGNQTLRFSLGMTSGSFLITWDIYWDASFQTNAGWADNPVNAWKTMLLYGGLGLGGTNLMWCGHDHTGNARAIAGAVSQHHEGPTGQLPVAPGTIARDPRNPTGEGAVPARSFSTYSGRWTRYWLEIRMAQDGSAFTSWANTANGGTPLVGTWDMMSLWIADEQRNPIRVMYQVPCTRDATTTPMYAGIRIAYDTSTNNNNGGGLIGPVIAYARNMVVLQNGVWAESNPSIFAKPLP